MENTLIIHDEYCWMHSSLDNPEWGGWTCQHPACIEENQHLYNDQNRQDLTEQPELKKL